MHNDLKVIITENFGKAGKYFEFYLKITRFIFLYIVHQVHFTFQRWSHLQKSEFLAITSHFLYCETKNPQLSSSSITQMNFFGKIWNTVTSFVYIGQLWKHHSHVLFACVRFLQLTQFQSFDSVFPANREWLYFVLWIFKYLLQIANLIRKLVNWFTYLLSKTRI